MNELPTPPAPVPPQSRMWEVACHLAGLSGFIIPFGNILGPLVVWLLKKAESPEVDRHGRESLNFQISALLYAIGGAIAAIILGFVTCGMGFLLTWPMGIAFAIAIIVLPIIAALKASEGGFYDYPYILRLVK